MILFFPILLVYGDASHMKRTAAGTLFRTSIFILIIIICAYFFMHSSFFKVKQIDISGNTKVSADEIKALSGLNLGINIFKVDSIISCRSIQIHPMIKKAEIVRHLPSSLEVKVSERKVWAIIPYNDLFLYVDEEGICIDKGSNIELGSYPIITFDKLSERVNFGQAVNSEGIELVRKVWLAVSKEDRQKISEFHYQNQSKSLIIYTEKGTEVRFGDMNRLEEKSATFSQIIKIESDVEKEGKDVLEYVDLRFKGQPVIKTRI